MSKYIYIGLKKRKEGGGIEMSTTVLSIYAIALALSSLLNTLPVLVLVASSNHAGEKEQERSEQSVPVYPV